MCICALSVIHAKESTEGEEQSCDKNLIATRNVAVSGGKKSLSEEVTFQDQESQDTTNHVNHPTNSDAPACLTESFADVGYGLLITNLQPEYRLKAPDVNENWTTVNNEKECADLMRRNKNATAYWFDNLALSNDKQTDKRNCFLYWKAIYEPFGVTRCVGLKIHDLCVSVDGVDQRPQWQEDMGQMLHVGSHPEDVSQEQSEKDCAEKMMKKLADTQWKPHPYQHRDLTHYKFDPQAKSGEDNCFVGNGWLFHMGRMAPDNTDLSEACFGRPQADSR